MGADGWVDLKRRLGRLYRNSPAGRLRRLERLCGGGQAVYVGHNRVLAKVVVDDRVLSFLMPADDRLLMPRVVTHGDHEPEVTRYLVSTIRRTDHCLDLGANFGYFTCLMASRASKGRTVGVEPDPETWALARDNVYINSQEGVASVIQAAAGEAHGRLTLFRRMTRSGNTSIIRGMEAGAELRGEAPPQPFDVECLPVDSLLARFDGRLDVVKIDVEGAEPLVFRGGRETLAANPGIRIVMEWSPGQVRAAGFDVSAFLADLRSLGLKAQIIDRKWLRPISFDDLAGHAYHSGVLLRRAR
jgi:FkbM family methyltransferase